MPVTTIPKSGAKTAAASEDLRDSAVSVTDIKSPIAERIERARLGYLAWAERDRAEPKSVTRTR